MISPVSQTSYKDQIKGRLYVSSYLMVYWRLGKGRDGEWQQFAISFTVHNFLQHKTYAIRMSIKDMFFRKWKLTLAQSSSSYQVIDPQQQGLHTAIAVSLSAGWMTQVHPDEFRQELQCETPQTLLWAPVQLK